MKKLVYLSVALMLLSACNSKQLSTGIDTANLDTTIIPQEDFYAFACGGWMKNNPLPAEYSRFGTFDEVGLKSMEQVNTLVQDLAKQQHPKGSVAQKIADIYNLAMDTARRNTEGIEPLRATLLEVESISSKDELPRLLGASTEYGLFDMYVEADIMNSTKNLLYEGQGGYALGEKEYYIDEDDHTKMIRAEYLKHIARMFELCGYEDGDAAAQTVLRIETRLAKAAKDNVELRDPLGNYHLMTIAELQEAVPQLNWQEFFNAMFAGLEEHRPDTVCIGQPEQLQEVGRMLAEESLEDIKTLFRWQVIDGAAGYLTDELYNQNFAFYGKILSGKQEPAQLWKRAIGIVNGTLGEGIGQEYVKVYFPEENKKRMLDLVHNLQKSLSQRIDGLDWMSDETKVKAQEKLAAFTIKIGYPDKWKDYSKLEIDPSETFYANLQRAARFEINDALDELGKPVDRDKWYMNPQTVNAYYNPTTNEICFPAGILQPPFFDMSADDAFNYGAIGVVIGHEMTHGFDDQGAQFDKEGNLNNWWSEEDKAKFDAQTAALADYFSSFEVAPGVHANGKFTLGENIADHGGLQVSFNALKNILAEGKFNGECDGEFSPEQRFFLAYANVWANNIRPEEILVRTKSDPHSLGRYRVNGALPQIGAWYEAWEVTEESPMYVAPENRVHIW